MGVFMGQLILDSEIDYDAAKEHLEKRIRAYVNNWAYGCFTKEYRESDEWRNQDLSQRLANVLKEQNDIEQFIDCLINYEEL
jgi:hypothetical protein